MHRVANKEEQGQRGPRPEQRLPQGGSRADLDGQGPEEGPGLPASSCRLRGEDFLEWPSGRLIGSLKIRRRNRQMLHIRALRNPVPPNTAAVKELPAQSYTPYGL